MRRLLYFLIFGLMSLPALGQSAQLTVVDSGSGINEIVTVTSTGQFKIAFEAADGWALSQWYDLVNDPNLTTNVAAAPGIIGVSDHCTYQNGIPNIVFYGDNDSVLHQFTQGCDFSSSPRSMSVLASSPSLVVIQTSNSPTASALSIDTNVVVTKTYYIYPNGKIYVHESIHVTNAQNLTSAASGNYIMEIGLNDPSGGSSNTT